MHCGGGTPSRLFILCGQGSTPSSQTTNQPRNQLARAARQRQPSKQSSNQPTKKPPLTILSVLCLCCRNAVYTLFAAPQPARNHMYIAQLNANCSVANNTDYVAKNADYSVAKKTAYCRKKRARIAKESSYYSRKRHCSRKKGEWPSRKHNCHN